MLVRKEDPKKVNLVATLVHGMRVEDALLQLQVTVKRASKTVYQVIHSVWAKAPHNHGLVPERLLIDRFWRFQEEGEVEVGAPMLRNSWEAFACVVWPYVGNEYFRKRVLYHSKGRSGTKMRPECRLTKVVCEITPRRPRLLGLGSAISSSTLNLKGASLLEREDVKCQVALVTKGLLLSMHAATCYLDGDPRARRNWRSQLGVTEGNCTELGVSLWSAVS
ncbi:hypothetical protein LguiB_002324 [Lonicera macranthoides]